MLGGPWYNCGPSFCCCIDERKEKLIKVNRLFMQLSVGSAMMCNVDKYMKPGPEGLGFFFCDNISRG